MDQRYHCHECYVEVQGGDRHCGQCGEELPGACGSCGDETSPADALFCVECGISFAQDDEDASPQAVGVVRRNENSSWGEGQTSPDSSPAEQRAASAAHQA